LTRSAASPISHRFATLGSTNDELRRLAEAGARHGAAVLAGEQTAGRGRRGRGWYSPVGNLHLSVLLDRGPNPARSSELAFVAAVSLRETLAAIAPRARFTCKWPNDILAEGAKVAGMLLEAQPPFVILGTGVNVVAAPPPDAVQYKAISLAALGCAIDADALADRFFLALMARHRQWADEGFAPIRSLWLAHASGVGEAVTVRLADASMLEGRFGGLDDAGALLLDTPDGGRRPILAGDVFFAA